MSNKVRTASRPISRVSDAYSKTRTVSARISLSDAASLERRAQDAGRSLGAYIAFVLTDHVRPQICERQLAALGALLRAATVAAMDAREPELANQLQRICRDAIERLERDRA